MGIGRRPSVLLERDGAPPLFAIVDANLDQVEEPLRLAA